MQPVQEQAQRNKEAISAAGHAGRRADQLGTDNAAAEGHQAQQQRQDSLNTDTRNRFANASLATDQNSSEAHASSARCAGNSMPNHLERDIGQKSAQAQQLNTRSAMQQPDSRQSPGRDKRSREESRGEHSSKARRQSADGGPCSPRRQLPDLITGPLALPRANSGSSHSSDSSRERAPSNLAARLLGQTWLGDMKGRFDEALGRYRLKPHMQMKADMQKQSQVMFRGPMIAPGITFSGAISA